MKLKFTFSFLFFILSMQISMYANEVKYNFQQLDSLLTNSTNNVYKNPDESINLGLSLFKDENQSQEIKVRSLILVSLAYTSKRDYQKALKYILNAEEYSNKIEDKVLQIKILFRKGILYQQLKIFDKSIENLEEVEKLALLHKNNEQVVKFLASSYIVKGFIYKDNLNCDIALEFFDKGIKEYEKIKTIEVNANLSIVNYNKGNCFIQLSEYNNAKSSFEKSIVFAKKENANSLIAFAQKGLAEVYSQQGNNQEAINLLDTALNNAKSVGDLVLNSGIYKGLFENYLALNKWEKYQEYYDLYTRTQSKIKISERNSIADSLDENTKHQNEKLTNLKKKFNNSITYFLLIALLIIVIIILIIIKNKKTIKSLQSKLKSIQN